MDIKGYNEAYIPNDNWNFIENSIEKLKNHPSILQINKNVQVARNFSFSTINEHDIDTVILKLNTHKPATGNIPSKVMVENHDICSPPSCSIFNNSVKVSIFPNNLKMGELAPCHKHNDTTNNYRPVSILPTVSKVFERILNEQALAYMSKYLSPYLRGFRKGYSTQYSLIQMLEK